MTATARATSPDSSSTQSPPELAADPDPEPERRARRGDPDASTELSPTPAPIARRSRRERPARPAKLEPGQRVGAWRVDDELGRGGMGAVYAVTHNGFGKRAALKLCHASILGADFTAATFLREARIVHLVGHPGVCDVFATGTYDNRPYLAMERLGGVTLGALAARTELPRDLSLELLIELCDVLAAAHDAGVVHRDLKLDNVFVLDELGAGGRRVKLLDWGVARIIGELDPMRGMIAGTLVYVAPDQIRGDDVGPPADVYSLAVLTYQLLLDGAPFSSMSDLELLQQHLRASPPAPASRWPEIPDELAATLRAMLSKDPARRPPVREVQRVFRAALDELRAAQRPGWLARFVRPSTASDVLGRPVIGLGGKHRLLGATVGLACLIASVASLFSA